MVSRLSHAAIIFISCLILCFFLSDCWKKANISQVINSDGRGYYAYLPALLLFNDFSYNEVITQEQKHLQQPDYKPGYLIEKDGKKHNKYFAGVALLLSPFFLLATLLSYLTGEEVNGYNNIYQAGVSIASLVYFILGLFCLNALLKIYEVNDRLRAFILLCITLGTNLFFYACWGASFSHSYSFSAIAAFLYFVRSYFLSSNARHAYIAAGLLAIIILIRPVNILVVLLLPFLAGNTNDLLAGIRNILRKRYIIWLLSIFFLITFLQSLLWYLQTGKWFIWSYSGEGFYFFKPYISDVLFSYRKGLFIYTPLTFISLAGLIYLFKTARIQMMSMCLFLAVMIYITASWWCWYYGNSFGLRAFIDFYSVFALLLAFALMQVKNAISRITLIIMCIAAVGLNLVQTYQYKTGILHPYDMTKEKYNYIFLKTGEAYRNILAGHTEAVPFGKVSGKPVHEFNISEWEKSGTTAKQEFKFDAQTEFGAGTELKTETALMRYEKLFVEVSVYKADIDNQATMKAFFVVSIDSSNGNNYYWRAYRMSEIPESKIYVKSKIHYSFTLPKPHNKEDIIKFYIWNPEKKQFIVDDVSIAIYGVLQ